MRTNGHETTGHYVTCRRQQRQVTPSELAARRQLAADLYPSRQAALGILLRDTVGISVGISDVKSGYSPLFSVQCVVNHFTFLSHRNCCSTNGWDKFS